MKSAVHFYLLAAVVGLVQGGTQALSRSLFATMVPKARSNEFFGFFSTGEKFAGIIGPAIFGFVGQLIGSSRWGIMSRDHFVCRPSRPVVASRRAGGPEGSRSR